MADAAARARETAPGSGAAPAVWAAVVPELGVTDISASLAFWCGVVGFRVVYDRPDARFAYLALGDAQIMLCELNGRWETAETSRPFGRGLNLQIMVEHLAPIVAGLEAAGWPIYEGPSDAWYRVGPELRGQREVLIMDPDGYLLRFSEFLGQRPG